MSLQVNNSDKQTLVCVFPGCYVLTLVHLAGGIISS